MEFEKNSEKISFWKSLAISYVSIFLSIPFLDSTARVENFSLNAYLIIGAIALIPTFFIHLYGIKFINLIKLIPKYILFLSVLLIGYFVLYGEHTYEDCILNHTQHSIDESATNAIKMACRKKYKN
jgi:hypothetical protein